jgi:putative membrane protein
MVSAMKPIAIVILAAGLAVAPASAQEAGSRQTREFVQAAGESDTFEMMEAYTALAQSADPKVTAFAREMIHDHGESSRKLSEAATAAGLKPPPVAVGASQSPFLAALQSARGREFDETYWQQQALAHRSALTTTEQYAAGGDSPAIRAAASASLPMIRRHLALAEQMARSFEGGS